MKLLQLFSHRSFDFLSKYLKALLDDLLSQDGLICDDIGWCSRLKISSNRVNGIYIGLGDIMEGTGTRNQVAPSHGASIGSIIIVVDVGRMP